MLIPQRRLPHIWSGLMLAVCFGAAVVPGRAQVYLFNRNDFGDGGSGTGMAVGDFNGDGIRDFAATVAADGAPGVVRIFLGRPDGTFTAAGMYDTGIMPNAAVAGDFNGDGKLDFAVVNVDGTVTVYLSNGDGTFSGPVAYPAGPHPYQIITGDFNGDGKLDLATTGGNGSTVSVLLGNGDGTFQPNIDSATLPLTVGMAAGDFNRDGKLDLVVGTENGTCVLLGNGDGTFAAPAQVSADLGGYLAVGDFNGDGIPDFASVDYLSSSGTVSIFLGKGDGTFQAGAQYSSPGGFCESIVAVDLNHDGKLDLAFTSYNTGPPSANYVSVLLGNGDGTFQARSDYGTGNYPDCVVAADINRDGHLDLIVANSYNSQTVSVLLGRGDGTFSEAHKDYLTATPDTANENFGPVFTGDFNGDGKRDLGEVITDSTTFDVQVAIILSNGDGTFQAPITTTLGTYGLGSIYGPLAGDFNNDGKLDLALAVSSPQQPTPRARGKW